MQTAVDLKQLRVAVTGGTSGLGLALVRHLVARGARVAFIARTAPTVEQIANQTGACGIVGDIGRKEDIYPVALQVLGNLGGLDALINNASALGPTPLALLADTECEELEQALMVGCVWRKQGRPPPSDSNLGRRGKGRGHLFPLARSWRHEHPAARAGCSRC
jgi:NAD(P)-dependent dehydrogenase (short-subunit alcohol dehydrogenase family)